MSSNKAQLIDSIQNYLGKGKWKEAVAEMENPFALNPDPIIRVRMGDAYQKLNSKPEAVREYVYAADLYAETGAVVKALAQYKLALRIDPQHKRAQDRMAALHSNKTIAEKKSEPVSSKKYKVAAFYSISNCQPGLRGVSLGNFLIKRVAERLKVEFPSIKTFCTLSPIPRSCTGSILTRKRSRSASRLRRASGGRRHARNSNWARGGCWIGWSSIGTHGAYPKNSNCDR